jgi:hypothetical protein
MSVTELSGQVARVGRHITAKGIAVDGEADWQEDSRYGLDS